MASTQTARAIRAAIYKHFPEFKKILSSTKFKSAFGKLSSYRGSLKVLPKIYDKKHPSFPYLLMRDRLIMIPLKDKEVLSPDFEKKILGLCKLSYSFNEFLNEVVLRMKKER
jgi:hypothetical protein